MGYHVITFRSVTYAQRGERILKNGGFGCTLSRTPRWMEERGCGYSLKVRCQSPEEPLRLLRRERIAIGRVYRVDGEGNMEELGI